MCYTMSMAEKKHKPLLDERGMHLTTVREVSQYRGACPKCGKPDKPLHRVDQHTYYCATCARKALKKKN